MRSFRLEGASLVSVCSIRSLPGRKWGPSSIR
jgi:hypothetical protein